MGKTPKQKKRDLARRLRRLGLRKELAKRIADDATNVRGQLPQSARETITEMRAKIDGLGAGVLRTTEGREAGESTDGDTKAGEKHDEKGRKKRRKKQLAEKAEKAAKKSVKKAKKVAKGKKTKKATKGG